MTSDKNDNHPYLDIDIQLQLLYMLGRGGFGTVLRGKWKARKGEVVAVKKCTIAGTRDNQGGNYYNRNGVTDMLT